MLLRNVVLVTWLALSGTAQAAVVALGAALPTVPMPAGSDWPQTHPGFLPGLASDPGFTVDSALAAPATATPTALPIEHWQRAGAQSSATAGDTPQAMPWSLAEWLVATAIVGIAAPRLRRRGDGRLALQPG